MLRVQALTQKVPKDTTLNIKQNIKGSNMNDWTSFVKGPNLQTTTTMQQKTLSFAKVFETIWIIIFKQ